MSKCFQHSSSLVRICYVTKLYFWPIKSVNISNENATAVKQKSGQVDIAIILKGHYQVIIEQIV